MTIIERLIFALDSRIAHRRLAERATGEVRKMYQQVVVSYGEEIRMLEEVLKLRRMER